MRLRTVSVKGFRGLHDVPAFKVNELVLLAGENDAGKSSLLDAIAFLLGDYAVTAEDFSWGHEGYRTENIEVIGTFDASPEEALVVGALSNIKVRRIADPSLRPIHQVERREPESILFRDFNSDKKDQLIERFRGASLEVPADTRNASLIEALQAAADASPTILAWGAASRELVAALPRVQAFSARSISNPADAIRENLQSAYKGHLESETFVGTMRKIEADLEELLVGDANDLRQHIQARFGPDESFSIDPKVNLNGKLESVSVAVVDNQGRRIELSKQGSGHARRVAFAVWEHTAAKLKDSSRDIVLLYDEPDTHLDFHHQRAFMNLVQEQAQNEQVTIVIATHSMNLIDGVDISDVMHVARDDESPTTIVKSLANDSEVGLHLGRIAASVGLRNTVLLHERLFVGVEGDTETQALPVLFHLVTGRHLQSSGIAVWGGANNDGALRFTEFLVANKRNVLLFIDTDSLQVKPFKNDGVRRFGLDPAQHLMTIGTMELEDIFPNDQWVACANANWPRVDGTAWTDAHFERLRTQKFSAEIEKMLRLEGSVEISGKPAVLVTLAMSLTEANQVPQVLRDAFAVFIERAQ